MAKKLGLAQARHVVDTILDAATARNLRFAAAVVDSGGEVICMARTDGASGLNARMCVNKAYTAVKWRQNTKALKERLFDMSLGDERRDIAWFGDPRFTPVWGGILLTADDGTVLGALGESGGTPAQDEELGQLGAKAFAGL
jgi:glc operon protein GlcG